MDKKTRYLINLRNHLRNNMPGEFVFLLGENTKLFCYKNNNLIITIEYLVSDNFNYLHIQPYSLRFENQLLIITE